MLRFVFILIFIVSPVLAEEADTKVSEEKLRQLEALIYREAKEGKLTLEKIQEIERKYLTSREEKYLYYPHANTHPYVPPPWETGLEFGSMWYDSNLFWMGVNTGWHLGTCFFGQSQTCQQYFDLLIGVSARDSNTHYFYSPGLRWQFVNFPKTWSPFVRLFVGGLHSIESHGIRDYTLYGGGIGFSTFLHRRADFRVEARVGKADIVYSQLFISIQLKVDRWVDFFANKLEQIGIGAVKTVGKGVVKGVEVVGEGAKTVGKGVVDGAKRVGKSVGKGVGKGVEGVGTKVAKPFDFKEEKKKKKKEKKKKENIKGGF